jgi:hypothetical protein
LRIAAALVDARRMPRRILTVLVGASIGCGGGQEPPAETRPTGGDGESEIIRCGEWTVARGFELARSGAGVPTDAAVTVTLRDGGQPLCPGDAIAPGGTLAVDVELHGAAHVAMLFVTAEGRFVSMHRDGGTALEPGHYADTRELGTEETDASLIVVVAPEPIEGTAPGPLLASLEEEGVLPDEARHDVAHVGREATAGPFGTRGHVVVLRDDPRVSCTPGADGLCVLPIWLQVRLRPRAIQMED